MKMHIEKNKSLLVLYDEIKKYTTIQEDKQKSVDEEPRNVTQPLQENKETTANRQELSAKKIQHLWRQHKVKEAFVKNSYSSYMSIIEPGDEQRLLSSIMFGRHEAELRKYADDRIANPYIHESAYYHRCDNLSGALLEQIKSEFSISPEKIKNKCIIPVMSMKTIPIDSLKIPNIEVIKGSSEQNISMLLVPQERYAEVRSILTSAGLIATPWEIAQNVKGLKAKQIDGALPKIEKNAYWKDLPNTKKGLLASTLFYKLKKTANNAELPTHHLAASLIDLLKSDDVLTQEAITRIALIIDMANTFYTKSYPRYAFCVYAIIHELSLTIAKQTNEQDLGFAFQRFLTEAKSSLSNSLNIDQNKLNNSTFIASPAASGTNAFMIAKRIASTMQKESGRKPSIKMYKPCYYELNTNEFSEPGLFEDPDIFVFSTGPIVNMDGLTPGVDINQFAREQIIKKNRKKPTTLIIDATTTLYKNLKLDDDVKQLVEQGDLSIIVFESHQKFGLLHTDQAQYGRLFGWCGKNYSKDKLAEIQSDAQTDFNNHMDLRVGANINHCCKDTLEKIKQQHFNNGALFRNIFTQANLILHKIVNHRYMAKNLDELYFVTQHYLSSTFRGLEQRNSFGHYNTTLSGVGELDRLCANASDQIDSLITSSKIYLKLNSCDGEQIFLDHAKQIDKFSEAEQIISIAITSNRINNSQPTDLITKIKYYCALSNVLRACESLKGRSTYEEIAQYYYKLQTKLLIETGTHRARPDFLPAIKIAYNDNFFSEKNLGYLKLSRELCQFVLLASSCSIQLNNEIIEHLASYPNALYSLIEKKELLIEKKELFQYLAEKKIKVDYKTLESLALTKEALPCLEDMIRNDFPIDSNNIKMLANLSVTAYLDKNKPVSNDFISILTTLHSSGITMDNKIMDLAKDNEFIKLVSLINNTNNDILMRLKKGDINSTKYYRCVEYSPSYLKQCFEAIKVYKTSDKNPEDKKALLISAINQANAKYTDNALREDRSVLKFAFKCLMHTLISFFVSCPTANRVIHHGVFATQSTKKLHHMVTELNESIPSAKPKT